MLNRRKLSLFLILVFASFSLLIFPLHRKFLFYWRLKKALKKEILEIENSSKEFSFFFKDLHFPYIRLSYRANCEYPAASLIKLPIVVVAFQAEKEGRLALDDKVVVKNKDVAVGSGIIKKGKLPAYFTLRELCKLSLAYSDNTATNKIIDLLGFKYINENFKRLGIKKTILTRKIADYISRRRGKENFTTAYDIALLLEKIYKGKVVNRLSSYQILFFLKKQIVNDRIPYYLPKYIEIAHKTGLEKGVVHDAGIVFTPYGNYILCILTKGFNNYREAKKFIAKLSLLTYKYYIGNIKTKDVYNK